MVPAGGRVGANANVHAVSAAVSLSSPLLSFPLLSCCVANLYLVKALSRPLQGLLSRVFTSAQQEAVHRLDWKDASFDFDWLASTLFRCCLCLSSGVFVGVLFCVSRPLRRITGAWFVKEHHGAGVLPWCATITKVASTLSNPWVEYVHSLAALHSNLEG